MTFLSSFSNLRIPTVEQRSRSRVFSACFRVVHDGSQGEEKGFSCKIWIGIAKSLLSTAKLCPFVPSWQNMHIFLKDTAEKCSAFFIMFPQTFQNTELYSKLS